MPAIVRHGVVRQGAFAVLALLVMPLAKAEPQSGKIEVGVGMVSFLYSHYSELGPFQDSYTATDITFGWAQRATVAFYLSDKVAFEPGISLLSEHYTESGHSNTNTFLTLDAGVPFYLGQGGGHYGPYVEPIVGMDVQSSSGSSSENQIILGAGFGTKMRVGDHASFRLAAELIDGLKHESDDRPAYVRFGVTFGVSVFLK